MTKLSPAYAPTVAAALRRAGFNPVSPAQHSREGIKVKHGSRQGCVIVLDFDSPALVNEMREQLVETLDELAYEFRIAGDELQLVYVDGRLADDEPVSHPLIALIPASELRAGHVLAPHPNSPAAKAGQLGRPNVVVSVTPWPNGNGVSFECAPGSSVLSGDYPNSSEIAVFRPVVDETHCAYSLSCENDVDADSDVCASHAETAAHVDAALDAEPLPGFRDWTRHADGSRSCAGYSVTKFGERGFVATAPDGTSVSNTGDWTSSSRPFASLVSAISACREHAAKRAS